MTNSNTNNDKQIEVRLGDATLTIPYGTPVGEVLAAHRASKDPALAAIVHRRCVGLHFPLRAPTKITPVTYRMREGVLSYRRTAAMILLEATRRLFPGVRVTIGQACELLHGYGLEVIAQRRNVLALSGAVVDGMLDVSRSQHSPAPKVQGVWLLTLADDDGLLFLHHRLGRRGHNHGLSADLDRLNNDLRFSRLASG